MTPPRIDPADIDDIIARALAEDLPDITAESIFDPDERGIAEIIAKEEGIVAGGPFAAEVFRRLDGEASYETKVGEGERVSAGTVIAVVRGTVWSLLSGERTALNLLQRASGIATATRRYVDAVAGTGTKIFDTRKTAPGLRALDKYAVATGGGRNHRRGLHDMFLIKNNHIDRAGSITTAIERARDRGMKQKIMVEVRNLEELGEASSAGPDYILLDNMDPDTMRTAVKRIAGSIPLEASGGITLDTVRRAAETGVDRISIGALTHSVRALDISMRLLPRA